MFAIASVIIFKFWNQSMNNQNEAAHPNNDNNGARCCCCSHFWRARNMKQLRSRAQWGGLMWVWMSCAALLVFFCHRFYLITQMRFSVSHVTGLGDHANFVLQGVVVDVAWLLVLRVRQTWMILTPNNNSRLRLRAARVRKLSLFNIDPIKK